MGDINERCEWGACDQAATTTVTYPGIVPGTAGRERCTRIEDIMAVCAECAEVAREEAEDLRGTHDRDGCDHCGDTRSPIRYRAYDTATGEYVAPARTTLAAAERDCTRHRRGAQAQHEHALNRPVVLRDRGDGIAVDQRGEVVWPPHGRTAGAVRWSER